jgi:hypothetical protein
VSALIIWFIQQPDSVKHVVTGDLAEGMEEAYAAALEGLAQQIRKKKPKP